MQAVERHWPAAAVHDTVQTVLRDPSFRRSLRRSLADRILLWLFHWLDRVARAVKHFPSGRSLGLAFVALVVLFVLTRLVIATRARAEMSNGARRARGAISLDDPWQAAEGFLADGRYEEAAHALYRGVVLSLGRDERLRLDPSRTSGDYARELRRRSSSALVPFRAFTRRFELAVYGHGGADATALGELLELSVPFRRRARAA